MRDFVSFDKVSFKDGFWQKRYDINRFSSLANLTKRFEETGRFDALRFNFIQNGKVPHIFYDSDVAKWLETLAYLIRKDRNAYSEYEILADEIIDCMERAQRPDGYLNSFHQQIEPQNIFKKRENHELYCAGHLIEAAIAYDRATGKRKLLDIMERYCDCIERVFFQEKSAAFQTPGHQEIELALYALHRYTGKTKYRDMADTFLKLRGTTGESHSSYSNNLFAVQDDVDIYHLQQANGHCVRALYFYTGLANMALESGDQALMTNLQSVFEDMIDKKSYITGAMGSTCRSESFTVAYDLPNDKAYTESCTAVAMIRLCLALRRLKRDARYGHAIERIMYNSLLSATSLDGKGFFYSSPLEIALEEDGREVAINAYLREWLPRREREEVLSCSCCPPNITRMVAQLGDVICFDEEDHVCLEQYIASEVVSSHGTLCISGELALGETVTVSSKDYGAEQIRLRVPEWCENLTVKSNGVEIDLACENGYALLDVKREFCVELDFHTRPVFVASNPNVRANVGRVALTYGPVVYCLEGVDNGNRLNQCSVSVENADFLLSDPDFHALRSIEVNGYRDAAQQRLYLPANEADRCPVRLKFIPYYAFANRGKSDLLVWVRRA